MWINDKLRASFGLAVVIVFLIAMGTSRALAQTPIPAEAQTSLAPKENFAAKTLAPMGLNGPNVEIPVFRYDLSLLKGAKVTKAEMVMNVERARDQEWKLPLSVIGGDELIDWDATKATLRSSGGKTAWPGGDFLKMTHGPKVGEGTLEAGDKRGEVHFAFSADGIAHLQKMVDGTKPNNGFFVDLPSLKKFPRVVFCTKNQRESLQPVLVVTTERPAATAPAGLVWPGDNGAVRCAVTADNSICAAAAEELDNLGGRDKVRIKHLQHIWLGKFDLSAAKGKQIVMGKLMLKKVDKHDVELRKFWLSTVTADFAEGKSNDHGQAADGSTFRFPGPKMNWARPRDPKDADVKKVRVASQRGGPLDTDATLPATPNTSFDPLRPGVDDLTDVLFGNGGSRYYFSRASCNKDGWFEVLVPGDLLQAILIDEAKGLAIMDGAATNINFEVASRESGDKPYLMLVTAEAGAAVAAAAAPQELKATATPLPQTAELRWKDGPGAFGYDLKVDGELRPRWQLCLPGSNGSAGSLLVDFLSPGEHKIELIPYNKSGVRFPGAAVTVAMAAPPAAPKLYDPANEPKPIAAKPAEPGPVKLWVADDLEMIDPQTGNYFHTGGPSDKANPIWDGATVSLVSAREAVLSFQVLIGPANDKGPKQIPDIKLSLADLRGPGGIKLKTARLAHFSSVWYHQTTGMKAADGSPRWLGDALVPMDDADTLPNFPNGRVPNQANQAIWVDLYIPEYAQAGEYAGEIQVSTAVSDHTIPLRLRVYDVTLPKAITFRHELNLYAGGLTNGTGIDGYEAADATREVGQRLRRLARFNRLIVNQLPYTQTGRIVAMYGIPSKGMGANFEVTDWSGFDKTVEPLATGKAFTAEAGYFGPLAGVPEPHMYLPCSEVWPMDMKLFYPNHPAVGMKFDKKDKEAYRAARAAYKDKLAKFKQESGELDIDLPAFYAEGQTKWAKLLAEHIAAKGWKDTRFQFYLNNKPDLDNSTLFTLDEPVSELDFRALRWFMNLYHDGVTAANVNGKANFEYRVDVSRPQWQFTYFDGSACDLQVMSSAFYQKNYKVNRRAQQFGWTNWVYGGGPAENGSTLVLYGAMLDAYSLGADGILPYYTGLATSLDKFSTLAMVYQVPADHASAMGLKIKPITIQTVDTKGVKGTASYAGPLSSSRLAIARSAVQDIELLNMLAERHKLPRQAIRQALRGSLNFSKEIISDNPDDPGTSVYKSFTPANAHALRKTVLEALAK